MMQFRDNFYQRETNYERFTHNLLASHYRLFLVQVTDGYSQPIRVWAQTREEVERYAPDADVVQQRQTPGLLVRSDDVILIAEDDGGYVNEGGHIVRQVGNRQL